MSRLALAIQAAIAVLLLVLVVGLVIKPTEVCIGPQLVDGGPFTDCHWEWGG